VTFCSKSASASGAKTTLRLTFFCLHARGVMSARRQIPWLPELPAPVWPSLRHRPVRPLLERLGKKKAGSLFTRVMMLGIARLKRVTSCPTITRSRAPIWKKHGAA